jgi:hypothetical protein
MNTDSYKNLEALINISANVTEITAIRYGLLFIIVSALLVFINRRGLAAKYFGLGILVGVIGLAFPGLLNLLSSAGGQSNGTGFLAALVLGLIVALPCVIVGFWLLYWPVKVAKRAGEQNLGWIIGLSAFSLLLPFLWSISLYLAYRAESRNSDMSEPASD